MTRTLSTGPIAAARAAQRALLPIAFLALASGAAAIRISRASAGARAGPQALAPVCAQGGDFSREETSVGPGNNGVSLADLDGDGDLDLASSFWGPHAGIAGGLVVALNDGNGGFAQSTAYSVGNNPHDLALGDLDGDLDVDVAVANYDPIGVAVLKNLGNGSFVFSAAYPAGSGNRSVAIADVDGDGDGDLCVPSWYTNSVVVLKNQGDGTFATQVSYAVGWNPTFVAAADLDGDGDRDLAVTNYESGNVSMLRNLGNGTFAAAVNQTVGSGPYGVAAADLDGDGDQDLAVANYSGNIQVSGLRNHGDGTFENQVVWGSIAAAAASVSAADLDGDGDVDVCVADRTNNAVAVLRNEGGFTLVLDARYGAGSMPESVCAGDVDGDGDVDLASATYYGAAVTLIRNAGGLDFGPDRQIVLDVQPNSIASADFDGDGLGDVAIGAGLQLRVFRASGGGYLAAPVPYALTSAASWIEPGDLDGDGFPDLLLAHASSSRLTPYYNSGTGAFTPRTFTPAAAIATGSQPNCIALADLDGDLDLDVAVSNLGPDTVTVHMNLGTGTFSSGTAFKAGTNPLCVAAADLDRDGDVDLAVGNERQGGQVWFLTNKGSGTFVRQGAFISLSAKPRSIVAGDFDADGATDLAVAGDGNPDWFRVFRNTPSGFVSTLNYSVLSARSVTAIDLDRDDDLDLIGTGVGVNVFANQGGQFGQPKILPTAGASAISRGVDLDGDGDADIAIIATSFSGSLMVLPNRCY